MSKVLFKLWESEIANFTEQRRDRSNKSMALTRQVRTLSDEIKIFANVRTYEANVQNKKKSTSIPLMCIMRLAMK